MKLTAHYSAPDLMFLLVPVFPECASNNIEYYLAWEKNKAKFERENPPMLTDDTDLTEVMEVDSEDYEEVRQALNHVDKIWVDKSDYWIESMTDIDTRTILRKKAEAVREKPSETEFNAIEDAAHHYVFELHGNLWSNNDDSAGNAYSAFKAGAEWSAIQPIAEESGNAPELNQEWEKLKSTLEPEKWATSESVHFYMMFCYGWHARKGEASFQHPQTVQST